MLTEEEIQLYSRMPVSAWLATFGDPAVREPMWTPKPPEGKSRLIFHSHIHDEIEIHHIRRGILNAEINGEPVRLTAGDVLIVNPFDRHSGTVPQDSATEYLHANFDVIYFSSCCGSAGPVLKGLITKEIGFPTVIPSDDPVSAQIGEALYSVYLAYQAAKRVKKDTASADLRLSLAVQTLLAVLVESVATVKNDESQVRNSRFVRDVQQYVSENFRSNITTEKIANELAYNTSYFCTMFKRNFGIPFKQYLNERRIEYATTWLRNLPLSEISSTLGYTDYNYFCRVFKKQTGMTPSEMFGRRD